MERADRLLALLRDRLDPVDAPGGPPRFGDGDLNGGLPLRETATTALRNAAVLAPLIVHDGPPRLLLTERAAHLAKHAGQVAFPGGSVDPTGETPA
ncbi:MAG: CoA pyrophosphatase, partial [Maricaulis sp.]